MEIKSIKKEWNATILDILKAFMEICKTHNLRYYCCAGTAIGAARHHGMIPWDDDIDVLMPRPDSEKSRSPLRNHSTSCLYRPMGVDPVASPRTQFGFIITCADTIFAAFLLISA